MGFVKKAAVHIGAVIKKILFIGFSIQIILGLMWLYRNFGQVQDFGEPDSALYGWFYVLIGKNHFIMYLLQLIAAFLAGNCLLKRFGTAPAPGRGWGGPLKLWKGLAMLTFPFALQCHLAIQPYSFMASLSLVLLSFLQGGFGRRRKGSPTAGAWKKRIGCLAGAAVCAGLVVLLSGAADRENGEEPGRSFEAAMASRFAWPTIWNDREYWPEELRQMTEDVLWEVAYFPNNMKILQARLEESVGKEEAKAHNLQIAKTGWEIHSSTVIRQIGWDVLGYMFTPPVFQWQLKGNAYDSYTGRNYEIMRDHEPVLTRYYVDYACWWFGWMLLLALILTGIRLLLIKETDWRRSLIYLICCLAVAGAWAVFLAMRGAGMMDYRLTIAVNELWLVWALLLMEGGWKAPGKGIEG